MDPKSKLTSDQIPQADRIERFVDIVAAVASGADLTPASLSLDQRDFYYYSRAARIVGLLSEDGTLTEAGTRVANAHQHDRMAELARAFADSTIGKAWTEWSSASHLREVKPESAGKFLEDCSDLAASTARRRGGTLRRWLETLEPHLRPAASTPRGQKLADESNLELLPDDFVDQWAARLPFRTRKVVKELIGQELEADPQALIQAIDRHVETGHELRRTNEFLDLTKCERLAKVSRALVQALHTLDARQRQIGLIAIHYFCLADDGEDDFASPIGFDDDEEVMESALENIGLKSLLESNK